MVVNFPFRIAVSLSVSVILLNKGYKSYLKNSLLDNNLLLYKFKHHITIEKREVKSLDIDIIINKFVDAHSNPRII